LGGCIWGTVACGLFRTSDSLFYGGNIRFLGIQIFGMFIITIWNLIIMGCFFALVAYLNVFRVPERDELAVLGENKHDGAVYSNLSWSQLSHVPRFVISDDVLGSKAFYIDISSSL
jgi:Amt family ammonium transporter